MLSTLAGNIHDGRFLRLLRNMLQAGYLEDWVWHATLSGAPQGGVATPPTQWAMFGIVTLRVAAVGAVGVVAVAVDTFSDGDAVSDGDLLRADENVLDEQSQHALAFFDGGDLGVGVQLGEEAFEVGGELEVGLAVGELVVKRLDLVAQVGLAGAQVGHAAAELVDGDQVLAERLDHARDGGAGLGEGGLQPLPLTDGRVAVAGGVESFVDLGSDELWVGGQQLGDVVPHDRVEVVGADRLVGADPASFVAVVVAAQAPVVVDLLVGGAGGGAVVAVSAARAGGQALEQRGDLAVAGGEALVVGQPLRGSRERLCRHDGRHRDLDGLLAGSVDGLGGAWGGTALQAGHPVQAGGFVHDHGLAEHGAPGVGGVAQHAPDHRAVPAVLAGAGGHTLVGQPAGQVGDRSAVVGVAAEQLGDQGGLVREDLVAGV